VLWLPDVKPVRIVEHIAAAPGETPVLRYRTIFSDERLDDGAPIPAPAPPAVGDMPDPEALRPRVPTRWEVSATSAGVKAIRYELPDGADELRIAESRTAKDLTALLEMLPGGLVRIEPLDDDPPEILGYWVPPGEAMPEPAEVPL
jgi:hypothetical protein